MDLEQRAKELLETIDLMKRCYYKGLMNKPSILLADVEKYVSFPKYREEIKPNLLGLLEQLGGLLETLPFDQIDSNSDFAPVFVMRALLDRYEEQARRTIEKADASGDVVDAQLRSMLAGLSHISTAMNEVGEIYRVNLIRRIEELKKFPGYEDFEFVITNEGGDILNVL